MNGATALLVIYAQIWLVVKGEWMCEGVGIKSREEWNAKPAQGFIAMQTPVDKVFIHHTHTERCNSVSSCAEIIRKVQDTHLARGGNDIGYNFLIGGDGRAYMGQGWNRMGNHTYAYDNHSLAFAFIGDFENEPASQVMIDAALNLIQCTVTRRYVIPEYSVYGHRDANCTDCPGHHLYEQMKTWPGFNRVPIRKICPSDRYPHKPTGKRLRRSKFARKVNL